MTDTPDDATFIPFDLDLEGTEALREEERFVLLRLLATGTITEAQAAEAIAVHRRTGSPLLDILGASGALRQREYAAQIAAVTNSGLGTSLVGTEALAVDPDLVRRFSPAVLMRFLFFPLANTGSFTTLLAVNPDDPAMLAAVQDVLPETEVIALVATERDVTRLMDAVFQQGLTYEAVDGLRSARPDESASRVFTGPQVVVFAILSLVLATGLVLVPCATLALIVVATSVLYTASVVFKGLLAFVGALEERKLVVTDDEVAALDERELPLYSILVPVYREPAVVPTLLAALRRLDYPLEKLDVLLLVEEDDEQTISAARAADPPPFFRFIYIPASQPRTKPKACNYGLAFCRGELVTIYDAEDIPQPDQLKKAVIAFRKGAESLVCVQAALNYFNPAENFLTRMFTLEYSSWFDYMLPGLDRLHLPIPLGGTSNHFRLGRLRGLGAWDPFNVTEDADLGIRASARGYTVGVVNSTTYEEANKAFKNWLRQRSRWIKGYMQTWLVHNRHPLKLLREIGPVRWLSYQFLIGGSVATFLINPLLWLCTIVWLLFRPDWVQSVFTGWVLDMALFTFLFGNMIGIYLSMLAVFRRRLFGLTTWALLIPIYWLLHSVAAYMGLWQLFTKPFYWEKTDHGLTSVHSQAMLAESAAGDVGPLVAPA
jgi:glycosyltransferase XagB